MTVTPVRPGWLNVTRGVARERLRRAEADTERLAGVDRRPVRDHGERGGPDPAAVLEVAQRRRDAEPREVAALGTRVPSPPAPVHFQARVPSAERLAAPRRAHEPAGGVVEAEGRLRVAGEREGQRRGRLERVAVLGEEVGRSRRAPLRVRSTTTRFETVARVAAGVRHPDLERVDPSDARLPSARCPFQVAFHAVLFVIFQRADEGRSLVQPRVPVAGSLVVNDRTVVSSAPSPFGEKAGTVTAGRTTGAFVSTISVPVRRAGLPAASNSVRATR